MQAAIGYLRVSAREQGRSGLALAGGQCNEYYTHDYSGDAAVHCVPCQVHTIQTHGSLEPAPCECCKFAQLCASEHLACAAYSMFLHDQPAARWRLAPRAPTTERYEALLG